MGVPGPPSHRGRRRSAHGGLLLNMKIKRERWGGERGGTDEGTQREEEETGSEKWLTAGRKMTSAGCTCAGRVTLRPRAIGPPPGPRLCALPPSRHLLAPTLGGEGQDCTRHRILPRMNFLTGQSSSSSLEAEDRTSKQTLKRRNR